MRRDHSASARRSRAARWVTIAAIAALTALLAVGLITFFADPLELPPGLWDALDQRASVVSMFIGAVGLIIAVAALLLQIRAEENRSPEPGWPEQRPSSNSAPRVYGGDHIEFHHNVIRGKVVGKQVNDPALETRTFVDDRDERG
jgi:hypothetical protein